MPNERTPSMPYGTAIHEAIASGELHKMKAVAKEAEGFVARHGDISAALEILKAEIRKLESRIVGN